MINRYSRLHIMILASLPCVSSYASDASHASMALAEVPNPQGLQSFQSLQVKEMDTKGIKVDSVTAANIKTPIVTAQPVIKTAANTVIKPAADLSSSTLPAMNEQRFSPTLVGVFINGKERDSLDVLYDASADANSYNNEHYYLAIDDLSRLTMVSFISDDISSGYQVSTPIGDTTLATEHILSYQGQDYVALSSLKKLGITADYSQQDLAVSLNMGWRPLQSSTSAIDDAGKNLPIDYRPNRAGLLGLSFNSSLTASESNGSQTNNQSTTSRQIYADLGAFGYALGGVWGVKALGYDYSSSNDSNDKQKDDNRRPPSNDKNFVQNAFGGLTYLPSDWDDWQLDNLYWAKSGNHIATRLGINQPNSLGQGVRTSGSEFTGALVAYSNRNIARHLSYFDENSRSLLQNTNQDYQNLSGIGEAGGVAELRINGRGIARVQIGLDGRYEFLNLDVSQLTLTETLVEMAIYAYPLAQQPLEVRAINLGKRRTNVATDELLIETGIGLTGDLINNNNKYRSRYNNTNDDSHTAAHVYAEYGVNNRLAVRGGVNNNVQNIKDSDSSLSWHVGANVSPSTYTNADFSYAHTPIQDLWQAQLEYQRKKLQASYQYQARNYESNFINAGATDAERTRQLNEQRHQLLLSYRPSDRTNISLNQYYDDLTNNAYYNELTKKTIDLDGYHAYASINHRFSDALNGSVNWDSRGDRYGYRLLWQDAYLNRGNDKAYNARGRNTVGLSGDNNSDTLSLRHQFNDRMSVGQAFSNLHGQSSWLYQGDVSYRFDQSFLNRDGTSGIGATDNLINIGYSFYDNKIGWLADWQLTHRNGVNFSLGYKHRYVDAISKGRYDDLIIGNSLIGGGSLPAWTQNNYLYAKLSFDMFKAPKQGLKFGNYPRQSAGSVVVDISHPANSPIDHASMSFELDKQKVRASLLGSQANSSQYLISNIKAGDYTLTMDSENLPLEYSTSELPTPRIRVSNYAPTSVPLQLQNTYGLSGKLADAKEGVAIDIYQDNMLIQTITTSSYGYFQAFGLQPNTYRLKAQGYEDQSVNITNDFVMRMILQPLQTIASQ